MRVLWSFLFSVTLLAACDNSTKSDASATISTDPCAVYDQLKGPFSAGHMRGSMIFSGGLSGTMEVTGVDYNEMTCTYTITDCATGTADMKCDGAPYQTTITFDGADRIKIGSIPYDRGTGEAE